MTTHMKETIDLFSFQGMNLQATFYRPKQVKIKAVILYFHGGGLIFGSRDDLSRRYIERLTSSGLGIIAADYPLSPETKMATILETTYKMTDWLVESFLVKLGLDAYFLMGRSAGGFLALKNGVYANQLAIQPRGVISLYGYFNLMDASFSTPNRHYLNYPQVKDQLLDSLIQDEPILEATDPNRYLIYLAARQKGNWLSLLVSSKDQLKEFSINKEDLIKLPPLFLAAAIGDPDVPVRQSRQLGNIHPHATLTLYEADEHDFDRTHESTIGMQLYNKIVSWMLEMLNK